MNINRQEARMLGELLVNDLEETYVCPAEPQALERLEDLKKVKQELKDRLLSYANEGKTIYAYIMDNDSIIFNSKEDLIDFKYNLANEYDKVNNLEGKLSSIFKKRRIEKEMFNPYDPECKKDEEFLINEIPRFFRILLFQENYCIESRFFGDLLKCIKPLKSEYYDSVYKTNGNYRTYINRLRAFIKMLEKGKKEQKRLKLVEELV